MNQIDIIKKLSVQCLTQASLDPRPHFPLHLGKWAWYRLLAHALISPRYLGALDNIVYTQ